MIIQSIFQYSIKEVLYSKAGTVCRSSKLEKEKNHNQINYVTSNISTEISLNIYK